jgi:hypothetical protein
MKNSINFNLLFIYKKNLLFIKKNNKEEETKILFEKTK